MINVADIEYRDVVSHNVELFIAELVDLIYEGWTISPSNPGTTVGVYSSSMAVTLQRHKDDKPKLSRAEILANAREAKKAKTNVATLDTESIIIDAIVE